MGFLDDIGDAFEDVGSAIVGAAEAVVDVVVDAGSAVVNTVTTVAEPVFDFGSTLLSPVFGLGETVVDVVTDPVGAVTALGDIITDPVGAVEDAFGAVYDYGTGLGSDLVGIVGGVGEAAYDLTGDAIRTGLGVVGTAGGVAGDLVGGAAGLVNAATGGLAEEALNLIDDTVLDGVDYITGGVINVDFDNGGLTAEVGIDNFLSVGAGISGDGVTATADAPGLGVDVGFTGEDGATLLLDENIPGFELPAGAQVGLGVSADGGAGIIASVPDLGITVDILGDYDADLTLEQIEALSGGGSARVAAPAADPTAGGAAPLEADAFQTMTAAAPAPEADQFVAAAQAPAAPEFEPDAQTAFVQELTQADTVADAADDLWEGLP